jgi:tryptophanyl-tRNA synthetase
MGNILGMVLPAIALQKTHQTFYFVADLHALTSVRDPKAIFDNTLVMTAVFIACGLDTNNGAFFKQSDIPEIPELAWYLACVTSMGDLTRAHAYKAAKDKGEEGQINLGTFSYPVLMAADILAYDSDVVPVGKDQAQHVEMARAGAKRLNHYYGDVLKEPKELIQEDVGVVPGIDGRKMSKSYGNGIDPFLPANQVKKQVMAIVTDSKGLDDVKDPDSDNVVALYKLMATAEQLKSMQDSYRKGGYGYGHAKLALLEAIEARFAPMRDTFNRLMADPAELQRVLKVGAERARERTTVVLDRVRKAQGTR